jgi:hypothetical protein
MNYKQVLRNSERIKRLADYYSNLLKSNVISLCEYENVLDRGLEKLKNKYLLGTTDYLTIFNQLYPGTKTNYHNGCNLPPQFGRGYTI